MSKRASERHVASVDKPASSRYSDLVEIQPAISYPTAKKKKKKEEEEDDYDDDDDDGSGRERERERVSHASGCRA